MHDVPAEYLKSKNLEIRFQKADVETAEAFFRILNNDNFNYFSACPETVEAEQEFLESNVKNNQEGDELNFTIFHDGKIIGAVGLRINSHRKYIAEAGYFIDEEHWGRGFATEVMTLIDRIALEVLDIKRIELIMDVRNVASEKVAIKLGYQKEGIARNILRDRSGKLAEAYVYSKTAGE